MGAFEDHGGLRRDQTPLTYPDHPLDLTLISFVTTDEDIVSLFRTVRMDLLTKWVMICSHPTTLAHRFYSPKIKWSIEKADRTEPTDLAAVITVADPVGFVYFHNLTDTTVTSGDATTSGDVTASGDDVIILPKTQLDPEFWLSFSHLTNYLTRAYKGTTLFSPSTWHNLQEPDWFSTLSDLLSRTGISMPTVTSGAPADLDHRLNVYTIDVSQAYTPLCSIGGLYGTDKSPWHIRMHDRHGYTALYHLLFRSLRHRPIVMGEIGILFGNSLKMWREYFHPASKLVAFDYDTALLDKAQADVKLFMDVTKEEVIEQALTEGSSGGYDIILDDSSHTLRDQLRIIRVAFRFVKPGGVLVIEDIFRAIPPSHFKDAIDSVADLVDACDWYEVNHTNANTSGWNNNSVLVLTRRH